MKYQVNTQCTHVTYEKKLKIARISEGIATPASPRLIAYNFLISALLVRKIPFYSDTTFLHDLPVSLIDPEPK
jgi:hypothetical protein